MVSSLHEYHSEVNTCKIASCSNMEFTDKSVIYINYIVHTASWSTE